VSGASSGARWRAAALASTAVLLCTGCLRLSFGDGGHVEVSPGGLPDCSFGLGGICLWAPLTKVTLDATPMPGFSVAGFYDGRGFERCPGRQRCAIWLFWLEQISVVFTPAAYVPASQHLGADGILYLHDPAHNAIRRWNARTRQHLEPFWLSPDSRHVAYSAENRRLYVSYGDGTITQIDLAPQPRVLPFAKTPLATDGLATAGSIVVASDASGAWNTHYTFLPDGTRVSAVEWNYFSREYAWSPVRNRLYFFRDDTSPNDLQWESINPATGKITGAGESPYHGDFVIRPPIRVSQDGTRVLLGSGDLYDAVTLEVKGVLTIDPDDAVWLADGGLVTLRQGPSGQTLLEQWTPDLRLYNTASYAGTPLRVFQHGGEFLVVTELHGAPAFQFYVPTNDGDGDGVLNQVDAFPTDPAASLDSDGDGYPDAWNPGKGPADSTMGLTALDAFPLDSACQLPEQALPGDASLCDIAGAIPPYLPTPQQMLSDDNGIVYLLSPGNRKIFRWSSAEGLDLNPIPIGAGAQRMAYDATRRRLYVGYEQGVIRKIDLDTGDAEALFTAFPKSIAGLETIGAFVFVADVSGSWFTLDADGARVSSIATFAIGAPRDLEWDPVERRLYALDAYASDLLWRAIDPATGAIGSEGGDTNPIGNYPKPPLRVSRDGARISTGSGDIYDASTLKSTDSLPVDPDDALWLADGGLLTLRSGPTGTRLEQWSADLRLYNLADYPGTPLRVFQHGGEFVVVTERAGKPAFYRYVPSDDADGDGVVNRADAFPIDPAASVDSDGDGYPDAWNPGKGPADSTTGLTALDAFPLDSACQLPEHALPGDPSRCDVARGIPAYQPEPAQMLCDRDGTLYLLSPANHEIFRWSFAEHYHRNPIPVGRGVQKMAYSATTHRLYLGYDTGLITQIDLSTGVAEAPFAKTPLATNGLATAGPIVVASDFSGAWDTHYTFLPDGTRVSAVDWNRYSREYAWSPVRNRLYFFRDDTSPNDLHWESIDPVTGKITGAGESPYHGDFVIRPPIRVSQDGTRVLLGSGDLYDAVTIEMKGSLVVDPDDALWLADGGLVTLRESPNGQTLLEQWTPDLRLYNTASYAGTPLRVFEHGGEFVVVTEQAGKPAFHGYVPSDDADGDGVVNHVDAFPMDPAASLDSDGDGYPDAWNPGKGPADSTTGLTALDAFPLDSACQLPEQALPGDPSRCDIAAAIPAYQPSPQQMLSDRDGVVYLLSSADDRIFRWSIGTGEHLNPIPTGDGVQEMAYSAATHRLYLGYSSGAITQIDLAMGPAETPFATTPLGPNGLATAGPIVVASDYSGAWDTHYTFLPDGTRVSAVDWNYYSREYAWSPVRNRLYFFRDDTSPNDLQWESIDPATGKITGAGESPYHGDFVIRPPIRVSQDGSRVLLGSGDLYDAVTIEMKGSLVVDPDDALWLADGGLVTLRPGPSGTRLERWSAGLALYEFQDYPGTPLRVFEHGGGFVVVTELAGKPAFYGYVPSDDSDADGVSNSADAFPTDPAASLDSDADGYPDAWNPGKGPADSTTGLTVLDAFPTDVACQLPEHGIDGMCDARKVIPESLAEPFCDTDDATGVAATGSLTMGPVADLVPLCSGWMFLAEQDHVVLRHVFDGRSGVSYPLPAKVSDLELDEERKLLYAALPDAWAVARIDLLGGGIEIVLLPGPVARVTLGKLGELFASVRDGYEQDVYRIPAGALTATGGAQLVGSLVRYAAARDELVVAEVGSSPSLLARYRYNRANDTVTLLQRVMAGSSGQDLALSPDGAHVAFAAGGGNGPGYSIFDYDAANLALHHGEWAVGPYPRAASFDASGTRLAAVNGESLLVFDVASHLPTAETTPIGCDYGYGREAAFSRGGGLAFAIADCGFRADRSRVSWRLLP